MYISRASLEPNHGAQDLQLHPTLQGESHITSAEKLGLGGIDIRKECVFSMCFTKDGAVQSVSHLE